MPSIRIIQLNSAPKGLWRLYAINGGAAGDAVVFLSQVVAMALVQDVDDQGDEVEQRVAPISAGALTDPMELYDCLKPRQSGISMAVVHATDLPAAVELAQTWQHEIFSPVLAGHDREPGVLHAGVSEWQLDLVGVSLGACGARSNGPTARMRIGLGPRGPLPKQPARLTASSRRRRRRRSRRRIDLEFDELPNG